MSIAIITLCVIIGYIIFIRRMIRAFARHTFEDMLDLDPIEDDAILLGRDDYV